MNLIKLRLRLRVATIKNASCARVRRDFELRSCRCGNSKQVESHALVSSIRSAAPIQDYCSKKMFSQLDTFYIKTLSTPNLMSPSFYSFMYNITSIQIQRIPCRVQTRVGKTGSLEPWSRVIVYCSKLSFCQNDPPMGESF